MPIIDRQTDLCACGTAESAAEALESLVRAIHQILVGDIFLSERMRVRLGH